MGLVVSPTPFLLPRLQPSSLPTAVDLQRRHLSSTRCAFFFDFTSKPRLRHVECVLQEKLHIFSEPHGLPGRRFSDHGQSSRAGCRHMRRGGLFTPSVCLCGGPPLQGAHFTLSFIVKNQIKQDKFNGIRDFSPTAGRKNNTVVRMWPTEVVD